MRGAREEPGVLGIALCLLLPPHTLCTAGEGPWEAREEKDCHLACKSKDDPPVRHVVLSVIAWDKAQACQPAFNGKEVPSASVPSTSVSGSGCPLHIFHFPQKKQGD